MKLTTETLVPVNPNQLQIKIKENTENYCNNSVKNKYNKLHAMVMHAIIGMHA